MDFKRSLQEQKDESEDLKIQLKHTLSQVQQLESELQRARSDFALQLGLAVDSRVAEVVKESRVAQDRVNERNEMLIKQLCESHQNEVRVLRERLLELKARLSQEGERAQTLQIRSECDADEVDRIVQLLHEEYLEKVGVVQEELKARERELEELLDQNS